MLASECGSIKIVNQVKKATNKLEGGQQFLTILCKKNMESF